MTATYDGVLSRGLQIDEDDNRVYTIIHQVSTDDADDGPDTVRKVAGLPLVGSIWNFGNDTDTWAVCGPDWQVSESPRTPAKEPVKLWEVTQRFRTTGGSTSVTRCETQGIDNPLLHPDRISGTYISEHIETISGYQEADDNTLTKQVTSLSSSSEPLPIRSIRTRPSVVIEQNSVSLGLDTIHTLINTVNNAALWGLAKRTIRFANFSWSKQYYGTCNKYFVRVFEFEIDENEFTEDRIDRGTKVKIGKWSNSGTKDEPNWDWSTFGAAGLWVGGTMVAKDPLGNVLGEVLLDGQGNFLNRTFQQSTDDPKILDKVYPYKESNFLTLGIPTLLE